MSCTHCGGLLETEDTFCGECGSEVVNITCINCMHCGELSDENDLFCGNCGQSPFEINGAPPTQPAQASTQYKSCVHCGQLLEEAELICNYCGKNPSELDASKAQLEHHSEPMKTIPTPSTCTKTTRMPLVFLLDSSLAATPYISQLVESLNRFKENMCKASQTKNSLDIALIHFNDSYSVEQNFLSVANTNFNQFTTSGTSSYSKPIRESLQIAEEYASHQTKPYKPWVIMIAAGEPVDDISAVATDVQRLQASGSLRFMALGTLSYSPESLKQLTDVVFRQKGMDFTAFFDWLSECIKVIVQTPINQKPQLPSLQGNVYRDK